MAQDYITRGLDNAFADLYQVWSGMKSPSDNLSWQRQEGREGYTLSVNRAQYNSVVTGLAASGYFAGWDHPATVIPGTHQVTLSSQGARELLAAIEQGRGDEIVTMIAKAYQSRLSFAEAYGQLFVAHPTLKDEGLMGARQRSEPFYICAPA